MMLMQQQQYERMPSLTRMHTTTAAGKMNDLPSKQTSQEKPVTTSLST